MDKQKNSYILISNKFILLLLIVAIMSLISVELFYKIYEVQHDFGSLSLKTVKNDNNNKILILGDSRARCGLSTDVFTKMIGKYSTYNLGQGSASIYDQINLVEPSLKAKIIILCVTPACVFGEFVDYKENRQTRGNIFNLLEKNSSIYRFFSRIFQRNYFNSIESYLDVFFRSHFNSSYGFNGISELILYRKISKFMTKRGWERTDWLGSDIVFSKEANRLAYEKLFLENIKNKELIEKLKIYFDNSLLSLKRSDIKVVLVRLPISQDILNVENSKFPWFDDFMQNEANKQNHRYIIGNKIFSYPEENSDGSHLPSSAAILFSKKLIIRISQNDIFD